MKNFLLACTLILSSYTYSNFIYENNQPLIDLRNESLVTNLNSGDDQTSAMFAIGFNFNFYGQTFTQARMATNGCLHFLSNGTTCNDYTPDPLPYATYTMYPFWTDLIGGTMKAKAFNDKTVFGWYDKKEYNRTSSNNFEVILWHNSSFEYRYGALDVNRHDVLIGHQGNVLETYQYLFHDECSTGSTNVSGVCVTTDWNNTLFNSTLENGGSLYSDQVASGGYVDPCLDNPLYSNMCAGYWEAFDDQQCDLDPQYAPFCAGYRFEQDVGYFALEEQFDYGLEEYEYMGYDEPIDFSSPDLYNRDEHFDSTLEHDYFEPIEVIGFSIFEEELPFDLYPVEELIPLEEFLPMQPYEDIIIREIRNPQEETFIVFEELEEIFQERFEEERLSEEERIEEEIFEELFVEEEIIEEEFFSNPTLELEERLVEREEIIIEETIEVVSPIAERSTVRISALSVVSATMNTAKNSVSGTNSGNSVNATGNTINSGGVSSIGFDTGLNLTGPASSIDQFNSGSMETSESSVATTNTAVNITTNSDSQADTSVDTSLATNDNKSEADQIADDILADNIASAQAESIKEQESTGQYGEEDTLIAYINYNPAFDSYKLLSLPNKEDWYAAKGIYIGNELEDNTKGFNTLALKSFQSLSKLKSLQPNL